MRPSWSTRLLRAFLALWFVAFGADLAGVHACPMHAGVAAPAAHGSPAAPSQGGHDHHMMSGSTAASDTGGDSAAPHGCTCVGMGCGSSPVASIAAGPVVLATLVAPRAAAGVVEIDERRDGRAVHALPFAIGPPARVATA
jgi:hypothetical protein